MIFQFRFQSFQFVFVISFEVSASLRGFVASCEQSLSFGSVYASLVFPHHRRHHARDLQFVLRLDRLVFGVRGQEGHAVLSLPQILHGPLAVHFGNNDIAALGDLSLVHDHHVAGKNAGAGHGVSGHLEQEGGLAVLDEKVVEGEGVCQGFLGRTGKPGFHRAEKPDRGGDGHGDEPAFVVPLEDLEPLQLVDELEHGVLRAQTRHLPDFRETRHPALFIIEPRNVPDPGSQGVFFCIPDHGPIIGERLFTVKSEEGRRREAGKSRR